MTQVAWVAGNANSAVGSITKPTGTWDCLMLVLWCYGQEAVEPTDMTGWTLVLDTTVTSGVGIRQRTFVRPGASALAPASWSFTASAYTDARIDGFLNVDQTTPIPATGFLANSDTTGTTATGLSVTGVADSELYLASAGYSATSTSTPTGMTPREVNYDGSSNNVWTQDVGAGATGDRTFTLSTNDVWATHMVILQPVGAPPAADPPALFMGNPTLLF